MIMKSTANRPTYSAPIVAKATKVLAMIAKSPGNPGISEIASELNLAKSTTHGILAALEESGWVLRDPVSRKYTCGYAFRDLSDKAEVRLPLVNVARPLLEDLAGKIGEDIFLGVCSGYRIVILDHIESSREMKLTARPGSGLPIFAGGAGKIFLAHKENDFVQHLLKSTPIPDYTPKSVTDPNEYMAQLEQIRESGVVVDIGEYIANVWCIAVPIFHGKKHRRRMVAGFWVVGLDPDPDPEKLRTKADLARRTGEALSRAVSS